MTEQTASSYGAAEPSNEFPHPMATGFIVFAGVMMTLSGSFQILTGLVALFQDDFFLTTPNYLLRFDATAWGWIQMLVGLLILLAGFAVLAGRTWGRVVGIALAAFSALANFAFIPYYPFWSLTVITLDIFVIWALAAHGRILAD